MSDPLRPHGLYPPGCSVCWIIQVRTLAWVAFPFPGDLPDPDLEPFTADGSLPSEPQGSIPALKSPTKMAAPLALWVCWFRASWGGEWKFWILYPSPFFLSRFLPSLWNNEILPHRKLSDDGSSCFHCCFHGTSRVWRSGLAGSSHSNLCWVSGWVNVWIKPK